MGLLHGRAVTSLLQWSLCCFPRVGKFCSVCEVAPSAPDSRHAPHPPTGSPLLCSAAFYVLAKNHRNHPICKAGSGQISSWHLLKTLFLEWVSTSVNYSSAVLVVGLLPSLEPSLARGAQFQMKHIQVWAPVPKILISKRDIQKEYPKKYPRIFSWMPSFSLSQFAWQNPELNRGGTEL